VGNVILDGIDIGQYELQNLELFTTKYENGEKHSDAFKKQLIQHNIRIIANYYEKVSLKRMSELIGVTLEVQEDELSEMINNKLVSAKVNRPDGFVIFRQRQNENDILNEWRFDIHSILDLVDNATNLIHREYDIEAN